MLSDMMTMTCPLPLQRYPQILMAHGGGGRLMGELIEELFFAAFSKGDRVHDAAVFTVPQQQMAFTTDSYVVNPLFFPGGDIGLLAVYGTVNDLAMAGAKPLYLSASFILEEGLAMETLWRIVCSMQHAAEESGVRIITGDTKVVERGKGDGIYINTAGVGIVEQERCIGSDQIREGDAILVNGDLGRHGTAIMASRHDIAFEEPLESDCAPLHDLVAELFRNGVPVHCMRDLTRGGLASALVELANGLDLEFVLDEQTVAVSDRVRGVCEILGIDPLHIANEGRCVVFVPSEVKEKALTIMRSHPQGAESQIIGSVRTGGSGVIMTGTLGAARRIDLLAGEPLPRIC